MKSIDEMIAVMEASKTKEIESCHFSLTGAWRTEEKPMTWNWEAFDYRVKAQTPRRVWVNTFASGGMCAFKEKYIAGGFQNASDFLRCDEFIELTPEIRERLGL